MELFLLIVFIIRLNKWAARHDMQLLTKKEYDELAAQYEAKHAAPPPPKVPEKPLFDWSKVG